mgnify:CR=1 FL=1
MNILELKGGEGKKAMLVKDIAEIHTQKKLKKSID